MSTTTTPPAPTGESGPPAERATPSVGQWGELPPQDKKNGPNSKFAPELNAAAREAKDHPGEARIISVQKSVRSASGRASTIKRKLKNGPVNGLEFPAENFEIIPRGNVVYARYTEPKKADEPAKPAAESKPKADAKPATHAQSRPAATPDPKPRASRK